MRVEKWARDVQKPYTCPMISKRSMTTWRKHAQNAQGHINRKDIKATVRWKNFFFFSIISLFFSFSAVCHKSCLFLYGHQCRNAIQTQSSESTKRSLGLTRNFFLFFFKRETKNQKDKIDRDKGTEKRSGGSTPPSSSSSSVFFFLTSLIFFLN